MTARGRKWTAIAAVVVASGAALRVPFAVDASEAALVVSFGRIVRTVPEAGLQWKWPWHSVQRFDRRVQLLELEPRETLTRDPKNVVVEPYACWRLRVEPDALTRFVRAVPGGDMDAAGQRLGERIWHVLTVELSALPLTGLVNEDASRLQQQAMLARTLALSQVTAAELGIELLDVQLRRLTRPEGTKDAVYREMIAERAKEANYLRKEGERQAIVIRARAREQADKIVAQAEGEAQVIIGRGEAEATRTYGQAHQRDPEFFLLLNLLDTYRKIIDEKTTLVLSGDSALFRLLTQGRLEGVPGVQPQAATLFATTQPAGAPTVESDDAIERKEPSRSGGD